MEIVIMIMIAIGVAFVNIEFKKIIKTDLKVEKLGWRVQLMAFAAAFTTVMLMTNCIALAIHFIALLFGVAA